MSQQRRRPARTRATTVQRPRTARPSPPTPREIAPAPAMATDVADVALAPETPHRGDRSGMLAQVVGLGIVVWLAIVIFAIMSAAG